MGIVNINALCFTFEESLGAVLIAQNQIVHISQRTAPFNPRIIEDVTAIIAHLTSIEASSGLKGWLQIRAAFYDNKSGSFAIRAQYITPDINETNLDFEKILPTEVIIDLYNCGGVFFSIEYQVHLAEEGFTESNLNDPYFYKLLDEHINSQK